MTQNSALSLIAGIVIAVGFLVGWCAGAFELAPPAVGSIATTAAADRASVPVHNPGNDAHALPVRSESIRRDPL